MAKRVLIELDELYDEAIARQATQSLSAFVQWMWQHLNPGLTFDFNWHLGLLMEYLEAVSAGQIRRLVVNMPPRYGKSQITSVYWPVYNWIRRPQGRWLFLSGTEELARNFSRDRRQVVTSEAIQSRFPQLRLIRDQRTKAEFHNVQRGVMVSATLGGAIIGKGGDVIVVDDPQSYQQTQSAHVRTWQKEIFRSVVHTRLDDKRYGAIVLVQQRLHRDDLSALCADLGYEVLAVPAIEPAPKTYVFPWSHRTVTRAAGQVCWPARENAETLRRLKADIGSPVFNAQYLVRPDAADGQLFPPDQWRRYDVLPPDRELTFIQSWDFSFDEGPKNDYTVGLVAACSKSMIYLVARYKAKGDFKAARAAMLEMYKRYPQTRTVLVEEAANGPAIVSDLRERIPGLVGVRAEGSKYGRACPVEGRVQAGQLLLPSALAAHGDLRVDVRFVEDFVETHAGFSEAPHDDDVDACSQLVRYLQDHPYLEPASVVYNPPPSTELEFAMERFRRGRWQESAVSVPEDPDFDTEEPNGPRNSRRLFHR